MKKTQKLGEVIATKHDHYLLEGGFQKPRI
jgi:hypothetical protein